MFMNDFLANLNLDVEVERKLTYNLSQVVNGRKDVLVTPIAKEYGADSLISEFNKVFNTGRSKMNQTLLDLEDSNIAKLGPRSIAIPWSDRRKSLLTSFDSDRNDNLDRFNTIPIGGKGNLRPLSLSVAMKLLKNNTNSGLPYLTRKGILKERVLNKFELLLKRKDPCVLFTRTQEQGKTRNVWGYPMVDTLNEMCYYSPLLEVQKRLNYRSALVSPDEVGRRMTALILKAVNNREYTLQSIDFAAYDTTVKSKLQSLAFDYIKSLFQVQYHPEIDYIAYRFKTIGIVTPDGVIKGEHGVPTGSTFTNEVDSIVQAIIGISTGKIGLDSFQVQGDDGVYLLKFKDVDIFNDAFDSYGLNINRDKSYLSRNFAIYLQCLYHVDYLKDGFIGGIYPVYRALNRLMYQERWSDFEDYGIQGKDFYSIRTICILENCKHHPLFKEIVQFVLKHDKYSLTFSDQGLAKYVQMIGQSKGAGEILRNQYGDYVSGIKSFDTTKLIKILS